MQITDGVSPVGARRLRPHASYRESGVLWVGRVPSHWTIAPVHARYNVQLGKMLDERRTTRTHLAPYLRNVDVQWDRVDVSHLPEMDFYPNERARLRLRDGDLLVCEGGEVGRTAMWRSELGECYFQKAIHRVRPVRSEEVSRFFFYVMRAAAERGVFAAEANPNTIPHLTATKLRHHRFPFPDGDEQHAIAAFLDREMARIDALVTKNERLVETLHEVRASTITMAVTKGVAAARRTVPSGHGWIGDIPGHWSVERVKHVARLESGHTPSRQHPEYWENCTTPWFTLGDVWQIRDGQVEYVTETAEKVSALGLANSAARLLPKGTVMLSRTASVGFSAIMGVDMATTQDFVNWVCGARLLPEYVLYVFRAMKPEFERLVMGSTHQTIYMPDVSRMVCPVPPIDEQREIVAHIRRANARVDRLLAKAHALITRLREYRSALITAAVTGQIDVRGEVSA
jgi:type I restriction enzyme S subunit